ncbi:MAG: FHA domain-containing protein, partial [Byssovorax sp.]
MDPDSYDDPNDRPDLSTISMSMPSMSPDGAALSVLSGSAKGRVLRLPGKLDAVITLGKAQGNDLVIDDPTVSRRHL